MKKKKDNFIVQVTSPVTGVTWSAKYKGRKPVMTKAQAKNVLGQVLPKFPIEPYKTKIKKVGVLERLVNL